MTTILSTLMPFTMGILAVVVVGVVDTLIKNKYEHVISQKVTIWWSLCLKYVPWGYLIFWCFCDHIRNWATNHNVVEECNVNNKIFMLITSPTTTFIILVLDDDVRECLSKIIMDNNINTMKYFLLLSIKFIY